MNDWVDEGIQLLATPKRLRETSVIDFCNKHDVPRATFYNVMSRKENKKRILEITLTTAKDEAPEVLDVLIQKAKEGDMRAIDIYMDSILQLAKNLDIKTDGQPLVIQVPGEIAQKYAFNTKPVDSGEGHPQV